MKKSLHKAGRMQFCGTADCKSALPNGGNCGANSARAFTLVELLVVISIIAILAALLLPAIARAKIQAQVRQAQLDIGSIVTAVNQYYTTYSRYPVGSNVMAAASGNVDFTFGGGVRHKNGSPLLIQNGPPIPGSLQIRTNNDVIGILMDMTTYPNGSATMNPNHVKNPQQIKFLNAKLSGGNPGNPLPGVGEDGVYRDPWGNPYVISLDLNYDDKCYDAFYGLRKVSQDPNPPNGPLNGLIQIGPPIGFVAGAGVMVWSLGPDRDADLNSVANRPPNKDNVLSWK